MIRKIFFFLLALLGQAPLYAGGLPEVSTADREVWYFIQFGEGGRVFSAADNGASIRTAAIKADASQYWKFEGSPESGYMITNRLGFTLCSADGNKGTMVRASDNPAGVRIFKIRATRHSAYKGYFEISPWGNDGVSMNLFGGPNNNTGVGYWSNVPADANNCVKFVSEKEFGLIGKYAVIPYPRSLKETKEGGLPVASLQTVYCPNDSMMSHLEAFASRLNLVAGASMKVVRGEGDAAHAILMQVDGGVPHEGYTLKVNDDGIVVRASGFGGFFYALQTLKQLLPGAYFVKERNAAVSWVFPFLDIEDAPNLEHRGFMLDVGRHFFDAREVKRVIDLMALYKMNIFHWHLTEDQGWRIEIPEYPRLTEVGSVRKGSFCNPGEDGAFYDDTEYGRGMWYTQQELREVVAYARERNIDIVPEVDFPGHMVSAIAAYPELSCNPDRHYEVRVSSGVSHDVLNVGSDKVIDFLKTIMDNLASVFPYRYIHFGGDECPVDQWRNNSDCLQRVQANNLKGVEELQSWLIEELGTYVKEKYNRDIIVWDDFMNHWNPSYTVKPVVMCWRGMNGMAADKGLRSIACSTDHTYLDMMQVSEEDALIDEPYRGGWGGKVCTVEKIYNFNPYGNLKGKEQFAYGTQANMWTETTNDNFEMEYQVFPRLLAFAEVGWLPVAAKDWASFYKRLQSHDEILDAYNMNYAKHYIVPEKLTEVEAAVAGAESMLAQSVRGGVGYPSAAVFDALSDVLQQVRSGQGVTDSLKAAVERFRQAPVVQPEEGKYYQIFSASSYSKKQFEGSSLYVRDNGLRIHYTPQAEPEELWQFVRSPRGFMLKNVGCRKSVVMPGYGALATMGPRGTDVRIDKATIASGGYSYIPGVVTISAARGYNASVTGRVKRLVAQVSGEVGIFDDAALCYPGTWRIVEVTDFNGQLRGLCKKGNAILRDNDTGKIGHYTAAAVDFYQKRLLAPATEALEGVVTEQQYLDFLAVYEEFLSLPRVDVVDLLREDVYYYIQNGNFTNYYAAVNGGNVVVRRLDKEDSQFFWQVEKESGGAVCFKNRSNGRYAFCASSVEQASVVFNDARDNSAWLPELVETDQHQSGVAITDKTNTYSWYTWASDNVDYAGVDLRPKTWGASIWNFIPTDQEVTGIGDVYGEQRAERYYDLGGREVRQPSRGLYITGNGVKVYIR